MKRTEFPAEYTDQFGSRDSTASAETQPLPWEDSNFDWRTTGQSTADQIVQKARTVEICGELPVAVPVPRSAEPTPSLAELRLQEIFGQRPFIPRVPVEDEPMDMIKRRKAALKPECDCKCPECAKGNCAECEMPSGEKCSGFSGKSDKIAKMLGEVRKRFERRLGKAYSSDRVNDAWKRLHVSCRRYVDKCVTEAAG